MAEWRTWLDIAEYSLEAGLQLAETGQWRSSASRFYYAAYQAATALLLYLGRTPPVLREAWSHEDTPKQLNDQVPETILSHDERRQLTRRMAELRDVRIIADYHASIAVTADDILKVRRSATFILRTVQRIVS